MLYSCIMYTNALKLPISLPPHHFFTSVSCYQINPCLLRKVGGRWSGRIIFLTCPLNLSSCLTHAFTRTCFLVLTSSSFRVWRNSCNLSAVFSVDRDRIFWSIVARIIKLQGKNVRADETSRNNKSLISFAFPTC